MSDNSDGKGHAQYGLLINPNGISKKEATARALARRNSEVDFRTRATRDDSSPESGKQR